MIFSRHLADVGLRVLLSIDSYKEYTYFSFSLHLTVQVFILILRQFLSRFYEKNHSDPFCQLVWLFHWKDLTGKIRSYTSLRYGIKELMNCFFELVHWNERSERTGSRKRTGLSITRSISFSFPNSPCRLSQRLLLTSLAPPLRHHSWPLRGSHTERAAPRLEQPEVSHTRRAQFILINYLKCVVTCCLTVVSWWIQ